MSMNGVIRLGHRWLSVAFTAGFVANVIARLGSGEPAFWVNLLVLIPLMLLFPSGLYMFIAPYAARWRNGRPARRYLHSSSTDTAY